MKVSHASNFLKIVSFTQLNSMKVNSYKLVYMFPRLSSSDITSIAVVDSRFWLFTHMLGFDAFPKQLLFVQLGHIYFISGCSLYKKIYLYLEMYKNLLTNTCDFTCEIIIIYIIIILHKIWNLSMNLMYFLWFLSHSLGEFRLINK